LRKSPSSSNLPAHLERTLGLIDFAVTTQADGAKMPFSLVKYAAGVLPDTVAYSTLGLSRHPLPPMSKNGYLIRHELMILARVDFEPDRAFSFLYQIGVSTLEKNLALLRGEVVGPAGPLIEGVDVCGFYVSSPSYFPDEFGTYSGPDGDIVVAWLIPITNEEAEFAVGHGWDAFEDALVDQDPDLVDFNRHGIKLPH
jgi:hypothetical protein